MADNLDPFTDRNIQFRADSFFQAVFTYQVGIGHMRAYNAKTGGTPPDDLFGCGRNSHYIRALGAELAAEGRRLGCPVGNIEAIAANPLFVTEEQLHAVYLECPRIAVAFIADAKAHNRNFPKLEPYPIKVHIAWWGADVRWIEVTRRVQFILDARIECAANPNDLKEGIGGGPNDPAPGFKKELRINFDRSYHTIIGEGQLIFTNDNSVHTNICRQFPFLHRYENQDRASQAQSMGPAENRPPDAPDGPILPKSLRWKGNQIDTVEPKPLRLLYHLWNNRRAKVIDVEREVWGEESETDSRLKSAITKANKALSEVGCALQIHKSSDWLVLE
jgi:hypothetical protein